MPPKKKRKVPTPEPENMLVMLYMFVRVSLPVDHPDRVLYVGMTNEFQRRKNEHRRNCHNPFLKKMIHGDQKGLEHLREVMENDQPYLTAAEKETRDIKMIPIPHVPFLTESDNPGRWEYFFMKKFKTFKPMRDTGCNINATGACDENDLKPLEEQYQQWVAAATAVPTPQEEAGSSKAGSSNAGPSDAATSTALTAQTLGDGSIVEATEKNVWCLMARLQIEESFGLDEHVALTKRELDENLVLYEQAETLQKKAEGVYDYAFEQRDKYRAMLPDTLVDRNQVMSEINHIKDHTKDSVVKKQISVASAALHPDIVGNLVTADMCVGAMSLVASTLCNRKEKEMVGALEKREALLKELEERYSGANPHMSTEEIAVRAAGLTLRERMIRKVVDMRDANARDNGGKPFVNGTPGAGFWKNWKSRKISPGSLGGHQLVQSTERLEEDTVRFLWRNYAWFAKMYLVSDADRNDDLFPFLKANLEEGIALSKTYTPSATRAFSSKKGVEFLERMARCRLNNFIHLNSAQKSISIFLAELRHLRVVEELWAARLRTIGEEVGCATVDELVHWSTTAKTISEAKTLTEAQIEAEEKKLLAKHEEATRDLPEAEKKVADAKFQKKKRDRVAGRQKRRAAAAADADAADADEEKEEEEEDEEDGEEEDGGDGAPVAAPAAPALAPAPPRRPPRIPMHGTVESSDSDDE